MSFFEESSNCRVRHVEENKCHPCCTPRFSALEATSRHPLGEAMVNSELDQIASTNQIDEESITIKDSCDVVVETRSNQALVLVQIAAQVVTAAITIAAINSDVDEDAVLADLDQIFKSRQINRQKICIENSRGVRVEASDDQSIIAAQTAVQLLTAVITIIAVNSNVG